MCRSSSSVDIVTKKFKMAHHRCFHRLSSKCLHQGMMQSGSAGKMRQWQSWQLYQASLSGSGLCALPRSALRSHTLTVLILLRRCRPKGQGREGHCSRTMARSDTCSSNILQLQVVSILCIDKSAYQRHRHRSHFTACRSLWGLSGARAMCH